MFQDKWCFHVKENSKNTGTKGEHHGTALEMAGKSESKCQAGQEKGKGQKHGNMCISCKLI